MMDRVFGEGAFKYEVAESWEQLPGGWSYHDVPSVAVDSEDRVYVFNRSEHPVIIFNRKGDFVGSWGEGIFTGPHGITIGPGDTVYCVDHFDHTVRVFTRDGRLIQTIGVPGVPSGENVRFDYRLVKPGGTPFNGPTKLAVASSGDLYVADGYGNARVHCFSSRGDLKFSWGEPGAGEGEFNNPHAVAVAPDGRVFVADRENDRLQVFSPLGEYLEEWTDVTRPDDLAIDIDGYVYVVELGGLIARAPWMPPVTPESPPARCSIFDSNGTLLARWGTRDFCAPGSFFAPHGICIDSHGDLYIGEAIWSARRGGDEGHVAQNVPEDCHQLQKFIRVGQP